MTKDTYNTLPLQKAIHRMIRVNQAGEYGAVQIYKGQLSVLKKTAVKDTLQHMLDQEEEHLARFNEQVVQNQVRPTVLSPLWHKAGFALGALTALMGPKAAMACTVAVEEVIEEHYKDQEDFLGDKPQYADLKALISKCREEELEHRDIGYDHDAAAAPAYPLLSRGIKAASKLAIWLSKRV